MTEGTAVRTKRMGARFFKNPPQPHMCIRDSLKGCSDPCYVNVLSWEKVAAGMTWEGVPLYGGMKVCPPRTEKKKVAVFAVMANPEILKLHGKNSRNLKERSWLIDMLLDFVEKMNEGVVFNRLYTVLRDRDITGELKEIWMMVQSERAKAQQVTGTDELRRPVPQYAQYQEQQQRPHPMSQQHQHPAQQQQQGMQHPHEEHVQQPPRYQSNIYYTPKYVGHETHDDRYLFRDQIVPQNPQIPQPKCLGYQYPQLPQPMGPLFPPNIHPNAVLNCPPHVPVTLIRPEQPIHKFYERIHRMPPPTHHQQQQQQPRAPQFQMDHNTPMSYYEAQNRPPPNMPRMYDVRDTLVVPPPPPIPLEQVTNLESAGGQISTLKQPHFTIMTPPAANPPLNLPLNLSLNTSSPRDQSSKKPSTISFVKNFGQIIDKADVPRVDTNNSIVDNSNAVIANGTDTQSSSKEHMDELTKKLRFLRAKDRNSKKSGDPKIQVLTRHISVGDRKAMRRDAERTIAGDVELRQDSTLKDRTSGKSADVEDRLNKIIPEAERNFSADKQRNDPTRLAKTTTSLRNTFKILAGGGSNEDAAGKKKSNGQVKTQNGKDNGDDVSQVYTILRKPEATTSQEDVTSDMSQLSIKDCRAAGEVGTVLS